MRSSRRPGDKMFPRREGQWVRVVKGSDESTNKYPKILLPFKNHRKPERGWLVHRPSIFSIEVSKHVRKIRTAGNLLTTSSARCEWVNEKSIRPFFLTRKLAKFVEKKREKIFYGQARNKDAFALVEHDKK